MKNKIRIESPKNDTKSFLELFNKFKPLKKLIKKNATIIDVGCNVGDTINDFQNQFNCKKFMVLNLKRNVLRN